MLESTAIAVHLAHTVYFIQGSNSVIYSPHSSFVNGLQNRRLSVKGQSTRCEVTKTFHLAFCFSPCSLMSSQVFSFYPPVAAVIVLYMSAILPRGNHMCAQASITKNRDSAGDNAREKKSIAARV